MTGTQVKCPRCKGKGVIEAYKNISNGRCYLCNEKGTVLKIVAENEISKIIARRQAMQEWFN